jgi:hypothetical protein
VIVVFVLSVAVIIYAMDYLIRVGIDLITSLFTG